MKPVDVMSVTVKGQAQLPKRWRERAGLGNGGAVRVVEMNDPEHSLLITPIRPAVQGAKGLTAFLRKCPTELSIPKRHVLPFK